MEKLILVFTALITILTGILKKDECLIPGSFPLPLDINWYITSDYGYRLHPIKKKKRKHRGIDIAAEYGTVVLATGCGTVDYVGTKNDYGNVIIIKHANSYNTIFGHLSEGYVREGDCITVGDTIGRVGSTGYSTGNHLHYEVRQYDKAIDPEPFLFLHSKL